MEPGIKWKIENPAEAMKPMGGQQWFEPVGEYPKMLYKGDVSLVANDPEEERVLREEGYGEPAGTPAPKPDARDARIAELEAALAEKQAVEPKPTLTTKKD